MIRKGLTTRNKKPKPAGPPPLPNEKPQCRQVEPVALDGAFFSQSIIRFLIAEISLVAILLAAIFFAILTSDTSHLTRMSAEIDHSNKFSFANTGNQTNDKIACVSTSDDPTSVPNIVTGSESTTTGEQFDVKSATAEDIFIDVAPGKHSDANVSPQGKSTANATATYAPYERSYEGTEFVLFRNLATKSNRVNTQQEESFTSLPKSSELCEIDASANQNEAIIQTKEPFYGTKIKWNRAVNEAADKAKSEDKLVFLMHVSGNFTKEEFT